MDILLNFLDDNLLDNLYPKGNELWARDSIVRQSISIYVFVQIASTILYLALSSLSYYYFFILHKDTYYPKGSPQPAKGQVQREIKMALNSIPVMNLLTTPIFVAEVRGYSKLYSEIDSIPYVIFSVLCFLAFTDTFIYWIHRLEHDIPFLYKYVHKPHHSWIVPTSYASIAFHPVDGWLQSLPYHVFPFLFPLHKMVYLVLFVGVQVWTVSIHDGADFHPLSFINGSAHHTIHHSQFIYNYGQFFTFWDRIGGSHKDPNTLIEKKKKIEAKTVKTTK